MTTITNRYGVDAAIAKAITDDPFYGTPDCDITVTGLVTPPQKAWLEQSHAEEITEDVADGLWRLLGQSVHEVLHVGASEGDLAEERLFAEVEGWRIGGKADVYRHEEAQIVDFKVTSVYSFLMGDKPDWERQLNFYAHLWRENGFEVRQLTIAAILRDWSKRRSENEEDYPSVPYMSIDLNLWPKDVAAKKIAQAVREHRTARQGFPRDCTADDRWERPTKYAVMKKGQKRAVKLFDDFASAEALCEEKRPLPLSIQERPGEQVRCQSYCNARPWCSQADKLGVPR